MTKTDPSPWGWGGGPSSCILDLPTVVRSRICIWYAARVDDDGGCWWCRRRLVSSLSRQAPSRRAFMNVLGSFLLGLRVLSGVRSCHPHSLVGTIGRYLLFAALRALAGADRRGYFYLDVIFSPQPTRPTQHNNNIPTERGSNK